MEFKAFISYKHAVSTDFAKDLELHVKKYAKGPFNRPDKIFRDEQYLEIGGDLSALIKNALNNAAYLILLASPEAAESPWVLEELKIWCEGLGRADRIIIILTSGTIAVDEQEKKINWEQTNALPSFLKAHLPALPLFVDLSWATQKADRDLANQSYKTAINAIAAKLRGVSPNKLAGIEWKIRRRNMRVAWSVSLVLLLLLIIITIGLFRLDNINAELEASVNLATSRELAAKSQLQELPENLESAAVAVGLDANNESISSLVDKLSDYPSLSAHLVKSPQAIECLGRTNGSDQLHTIIENRLVLFNHSGNNTKVLPLPMGDGYRNVISVASDTIFAVNHFKIQDIQSEEPLATLDLISASGPRALADELIVGQADGEIYAVDKSSGEARQLYSHYGQVTDIAIGDSFIVSTALTTDYPVVYYDIASGEKHLPQQPLFSANAVDIAPDQSTVAIAFEDGKIGTFSLPGFQEIWSETLEYSASEVAFHPEGYKIAAGSAAGALVVFDKNGSPIDGWQAHNGGLWKMSWIKDTLFTGGSDGWVRSWIPEQLMAPAQQHRVVDRVFWDGSTLMGIDSNEVYELSGSNRLHTIEDWSCDKLMAVHSNGIVTAYQNRPFFYDKHYQKNRFPAQSDSLRLVSAALSEDASFIAATWRPEHTVPGATMGAVSVWDTRADSVRWLEPAPEFPGPVCLYEDKWVAAFGRGTLYIWDLTSGKLASKSSMNTYQPLEELAFLDQQQLVLGHLMGKIEIVNIENLDSAIYETQLPVGSIYELEVTVDGTILSVDIDGLRWFDRQLNYLGTIINTADYRVIPSQITSSGDGKALGLQLRNGKAVSFPLNPYYFSETAKQKSKIRIPSIITTLHH